MQRNVSEGCVSVIMPARNEERNIARAVRSLAAQEEVREIIVVDDQSEDLTPKILAGLKSEIPILRVIRLDSMLKGWLGKTHAVATGAAAAGGEWLLFTDADTTHAPGSLRAVLHCAEAAAAALLSLSPEQETRTWWEKAVIPRVFVELAKLFPFEAVSDPASPVAAANGQYMLIRRAAYDLAGGHAVVRNEILEDVELAKRVKASGGRILFFPGGDWVRTRMYETLGEMWAGWTKNLYLLYGRRLAKILTAEAKLWLLDLLPFAALLLSAAALWRGMNGFFGVTALVLCMVIIAGRMALYTRSLRELGFARGLGVYGIPGSAILGLLLLNSVRAHRWGGRVSWKGRTVSTREAKEATP